jgi:phospholipase/carboxylesterase
MTPTELVPQSLKLAEGFYTSAVSTPQSWPVRTFLPFGYEPNYPYPLLVFLHGHGSSEEHILRLAPRLSRRNYIAIALRGPQSVTERGDGTPAYSWGADGADDPLIEEYVFRAVEQTRRNVHIHSERIYLAGFREGAALAYRLALLYPERFAGVVSLNGALPRQGAPRLRLPDVRNLKVFIGHGLANAIVPLALARQDYRLFYAAGMSVQMQTYAATYRIHPHMLRDVDRWVQGHIHEENESLRP